MLALAITVAVTLGSDTLYARAESLLAAGALPSARRIAEQLERHSPHDPRALILLGRVHLAWPVIGRFKADSLFARALALDPANREAHYYAARVGLALGGDDGESMARRHLEHLLALAPDYRDTWALWRRLYRGDAERRRAVAALERHAGDAWSDLRRAGLLVELRAWAPADSLLHDLGRRLPAIATPWALLAQARFEQDRDADGAAAYGAALALAANDPDTTLWRQVRSIATPSERAVWARGPRDPAAFFRLFWARRDPHLATALNERLGEHFRRAAEARRRYALLHPASRWHHSSRWRALSGGVGGVQGADLARTVTDARSQPCAARLPGVRDLPFAIGLGERAPASSGEETPNLEDGLDDRGRVFVRHGTPQSRYVYADGETWCYERPEGVLRVTFIRRTGGYGASGDMVFTPVMEGESESAAYLAVTDRPTLDADLRFTFWPASFRQRADVRLTELLLFPESLTAAAVLLDPAGGEVARDSATGGPLRLSAPPGRYALLLDGDRGRRRGRYRGTVELPDYATGRPTVSSLLLASGSVAPARDALVAAAPGGLRLPSDQPLRLYAEVYGLPADDGRVRYEARYHFERLSGGFLGLGRGRVTTIAFARDAAAAARVHESVLVDPGRLSRGRYRLLLEIVDGVRGERTSSASVVFELR